MNNRRGAPEQFDDSPVEPAPSAWGQADDETSSQETLKEAIDDEA